MSATSDTDFPTLNYVPYAPANPQPAASSDSGSGWFSSFLGGLGQVANTGLQAYSTIQGAKLQEQAGAAQAQLASAQAQALRAQASAAPWYKAPWVIPAAVIGGILLLVALIAGRRR